MMTEEMIRMKISAMRSALDKLEDELLTAIHEIPVSGVSKSDPLERLNLPTVVARTLRREGCESVGDAYALLKDDTRKIRNMSTRTRLRIMAMIEAKGGIP